MICNTEFYFNTFLNIDVNILQHRAVLEAHERALFKIDLLEKQNL